MKSPTSLSSVGVLLLITWSLPSPLRYIGASIYIGVLHLSELHLQRANILVALNTFQHARLLLLATVLPVVHLIRHTPLETTPMHCFVRTIAMLIIAVTIDRWNDAPLGAILTLVYDLSLDYERRPPSDPCTAISYLAIHSLLALRQADINGKLRLEYIKEVKDKQQ